MSEMSHQKMWKARAHLYNLLLLEKHAGDGGKPPTMNKKVVTSAILVTHYLPKSKVLKEERKINFSFVYM